MALQDTLNLIRKKQQEALSQVSQKRQEGEQDFYNQNNAVDVEMMQEQRAMREALARAGQSQGGMNIRATKSLLGGRANKLAEIRSKRNQFMQGLGNEENQINLGAMEQEVNAMNQEEQLKRQLASRASAARNLTEKDTDNNPYNDTGVNNPTYQAYEALDYHMKRGTANEFLAKNRAELIKDLGPEGYYRMIKEKQMRERELKGMM